MGNYFGEFLISKGKVTEEQVKKALSLQKEERYNPEEIADFSGQMTEKQIETVIKAMEEERYARKGFSEVALDLKFISPNGLHDIVSLEEEVNVRIGRILVGLGYLYQEECDKYLKEFRNVEMNSA